jgi:hypothetical protein
MWETLPWILAAAFALAFFFYKSLTRHVSVKAAKLSEFISILFVEKDAYNANRKVFMDWLKKQGALAEDVKSLMLIMNAAEHMSTSYIDKAGDKTGGQGMTLLTYLKYHGHIQ